MRTAPWCCTAGEWSKRARTPSCSSTTAGTRANRATRNCKRASMPPEALPSPRTPKVPTGRRDLLGESTRLLVRAAKPDRPHFWWATLWLVIAAALEAFGPLIGKFLIDHYLLPRNARLAEIGGLLVAAL